MENSFFLLFVFFFVVVRQCAISSPDAALVVDVVRLPVSTQTRIVAQGLLFCLHSSYCPSGSPRVIEARTTFIPEYEREKSGWEEMQHRAA